MRVINANPGPHATQGLLSLAVEESLKSSEFDLVKRKNSPLIDNFIYHAILASKLRNLSELKNGKLEVELKQKLISLAHEHARLGGKAAPNVFEGVQDVEAAKTAFHSYGHRIRMLLCEKIGAVKAEKFIWNTHSELAFIEAILNEYR